MLDVLREGDTVIVWKLDGTAAADRRPPGGWVDR
jgi:DNA invertase Pin-like site-specific DNA recombinase